MGRVLIDVNVVSNSLLTALGRKPTALAMITAFSEVFPVAGSTSSNEHRHRAYLL